MKAFVLPQFIVFTDDLSSQLSINKKYRCYFSADPEIFCLVDHSGRAIIWNFTLPFNTNPDYEGQWYFQ